MSPNPKDSLAIVYGFACPLRCDFCCHPVERYGKAKFGVEETVELIREAEGIPSIGTVGFTGGDPFVYYPEIAAILEATRGSRLRLRIVTSAYWARSRSEAVGKLGPLVERGLTSLWISTDPSHQQFVPLGHAQNAIEAAAELGLAVGVSSAYWGRPQSPSEFLDLPEGADEVAFRVFPLGRAEGRKLDPEDYGPPRERFRGCAEVSHAYPMAVYPDGEVYPCCTGGFNRQAKLSFGNFRKEPLGKIVRRMRADRYTRVVMNQGFYALYELAKLRFPAVYAELPSWEGEVACCQLCVKIHSDPRLLDRLEPVLRYVERMEREMASLEHVHCGGKVDEEIPACT